MSGKDEYCEILQLQEKVKNMTIKHEIRKLFQKFGYDITHRYPTLADSIVWRKKLLLSYDIDIVLDIGANKGQFGQIMRDDIGYTKKIISFEPVTVPFELLNAKAKNDSNWDTINIALGDTDEKKEINIAGNYCHKSSSLLNNMLPAFLKESPESQYIGKELIEVKRLDSIIDDLCNTTDRVFMKIDTQGYESKVLNGAEKSLININTVQLEMSLYPCYEGELLFDALCNVMYNKGYSLVSIVPAFLDRNSGQLLQVDGIFHRF